MPRTRTDLIVEVLDILGITQTGQAPEAEDAGKVDVQINGMLADLARRGVVYVASADEIDDEYFKPLATILASLSSHVAGTNRDTTVEDREEAKLRSLQREPGINEPVRACYF